MADINVGAYERTNRGNTFYAFVLLGEPEKYVILPIHAMEGLIDSGHIKTLSKSNRYRAIFARRGTRYFLEGKTCGSTWTTGTRSSRNGYQRVIFMASGAEG